MFDQCCFKSQFVSFSPHLAFKFCVRLTDGVARIIFYKFSWLLCRGVLRKSLSGFEPMSVSRVAPDWDLLDALPTELHHRGKFCIFFIFTKLLSESRTYLKQTLSVFFRYDASFSRDEQTVYPVWFRDKKLKRSFTCTMKKFLNFLTYFTSY